MTPDHLLERAREIVLREQERLDHLGLRFNLFNVLDRSEDEEKGHSAMLATLLDPKGSHGQHEIFLRLFLEKLRDSSDGPHRQVLEEALRAGDLSAWRVETEHHIGKASVEDEGGRLDLLLRGARLSIAIENKIYATDGECQLEKYYRHLEQTHSGKSAVFILFLLTLDGREPSRASLGGLKLGDVLRLSYREQIAAWLQRCSEAAGQVVRVREAIQQYLQIVLELCDEKGGDEMEKELGHLLLEGNNLDIAKQLAEASAKVVAKIEKDFWRAIEKEMHALIEVGAKESLSRSLPNWRCYPGADTVGKDTWTDMNPTTGVEFPVRTLSDGRVVAVGVERNTNGRLFVVVRTYRDGYLVAEGERHSEIPGCSELHDLSQRGFSFRKSREGDPHMGWFAVEDGPFQRGGLTNVGAFLKEQSLEAYARSLVADLVAPIVRVLQSAT
ncbi:MAG TPA: PD-(D/E)XK nuclease family protein [Verrucomicrobiota bacterium]|nr:PD-(D/E)XK nuclease family protein [Verrucomicrobiota bacterium]